MTATRQTSLAENRTHEVVNQPDPLTDWNAFTSDTPLVEAAQWAGAGDAGDWLRMVGEVVGSDEYVEFGFEANRHVPELRTHDRLGHRIDRVDYHPSYHRLMEKALELGVHSRPWVERGPGAHAARAAGALLWAQLDLGHSCPVSMAYAAVPALRREQAVADEWVPRITSTTYDRRLIPAGEKDGALIGLTMTEKQGGSDVRANTTLAEYRSDGEYALTGHKWFCSAPMSDVFLVLAQTAEGLSAFLLPRVLPDGSLNRFYIQRLKDKLGNRSNASAEIELDQAFAVLVGEEGRGVSVVMEMLALQRLENILWSTAAMRQALSQAIWHCDHRRAFGARLVDQPLMANVLADLALEVEAATALGMRLASAIDNDEPALYRLGTAAAKYWVCKRAPAHVVEALECLGGNGFIEESILPRLYRDVPLHTIWEGSGNVIALDVLRAMRTNPESVEAVLDEVERARGNDRQFDELADTLRKELTDPTVGEYRARRIAELIATALAGSLLIRHAPAEVADAYCSSRMGGGGRVYGTLPKRIRTAPIVERARPTMNTS